MALTKISTGGVKDDAASQAKIADEAVDEARLQISNAGTNGQFLQKQSGSTGGLTWATATTDTSDKAPINNPTFTGIATSPQIDVRTGSSINVNSSGASASLGLYKNTNSGEAAIVSSGTGGANYLNFYTSNSAAPTAKLRINWNGAIGIGGANYGSSGQVLTSGGSGAAPSWAAVPPGGNTVDLVADGAIAAGKPVIITTAGKAQQIAPSIVARTNTANSSQAHTDKPDRNAYNYALAYDTTKDRVVLATENKINIVNIPTGLGTTSITLGSDYQYDSQGKQPALVFDPDTEDTYLAFRDQGTSNYGKIGGLVISGTDNTTVSCPTGYYTFHSGSTDTIELVYDTSANKIIIVYRDSTTKYYTARVAEVGSNQALTFGSEVSTGVYGDEGKMSAAYDASANRLVMCMADDSDNNKGKYVVGTVSGTSISFTSKASLINSEIHYLNMDYHAGEQKTIVSFRDVGGGYNKLRSTVGTVGSSSVTWGSTVDFPGGYGTGANTTCVDPLTNLVFRGLVFPNDNRFYYAYATLSGTTFSTLGTNSQSSHNHSLSWEDMTSTAMGNHGRIVVLAYNASASRPGLYVYDMGQTGSNANSKNGLGFAPLAISDGNTGTINLPGNVVGNQSGLTAGQRYYIKNDGTLDVSQDNTLGGASGTTKAGLALSATSLLIADYRS